MRDDTFHCVRRKRETKWILQTSLILLLLCAGDIATGETTYGSSPLTDNYLFAGCSLMDQLSVTTFERSHTLTLKFPPPSDFILSVQTGDDDPHLLQFDPILSSKDEWIDMELLLEDQVQLVFPNGSVWKPNTTMTPLANFREKKIKACHGSFLAQCPQRAPNWKLEMNLTPQTLRLRKDVPEVFSLNSPLSKYVYFTIEGEKLLLCWDETFKKTKVTREDDGNSDCTYLPKNWNHWMEIRFVDETIEIWDPAHDGSLLRKSTVHLSETKLTFTGSLGTTFVVHHLQGFPKVEDLHQEEEAEDATGARFSEATAVTIERLSGPEEIPESNGHLLVYVMGGVAGMLLVLLIVSVVLARTYKHRWMKLKQVMMLLRNMKPRDKSESKNYAKNTELTFPTDAPPLPPGLKCSEAIYLVPKEDVSPESPQEIIEHVYETINEILSQKEMDSKNAATETKDSVDRKTSTTVF